MSHDLVSRRRAFSVVVCTRLPAELKQVARLWQRDRASSTILMGWVTLWLNFRLKGYVSLYGPFDGGMVILQLCRRMFSHKRSFVARFIQLKLNHIPKTKIAFLKPPFGGLSGNVRTASIARWKTRGRLPIRHN